MHGDAFQLALVRCNWDEISNSRLQAAQVNAFFYTFLSAADNFYRCKSVHGCWDTYNSHFISQDMQQKFPEMCNKKQQQQEVRKKTQ